MRILIDEATRPIIMEELQTIMQKAEKIRVGLVAILEAAKSARMFGTRIIAKDPEAKRGNEKLIRVVETLLEGYGIGFVGFPEIKDILAEIGCDTHNGYGADLYSAALPAPLEGSWIWLHPEDIDNLEARACMRR